MVAERPRQHERAGVVDGEQGGVGVHDVDVAVRPLGHLVADAERLGEAAQLGVVVERDRVRAGHEALDVLGDDVAVAIGIDGDHHHVDPFGIVAEVVERAPQVGERRGTDVGAVRVAEERDEQPVVRRHEPERLAVTADVGHVARIDHRRRIPRQPDELSVAAPTRGEQHRRPPRPQPTRVVPGVHEVGSPAPADSVARDSM